MNRLAGTAEALAPADEAAREAPTPKVVVPWPPVASQPPRLMEPVPATVGTPVRRAALALHRRGFEVELRGSGRVVRTMPAAGDSAATGATVTVWAE